MSTSTHPPMPRLPRGSLPGRQQHRRAHLQVVPGGLLYRRQPGGRQFSQGTVGLPRGEEDKFSDPGSRYCATARPVSISMTRSPASPAACAHPDVSAPRQGKTCDPCEPGMHQMPGRAFCRRIPGDATASKVGSSATSVLQTPLRTDRGQILHSMQGRPHRRQRQCLAPNAAPGNIWTARTGPVLYAWPDGSQQTRTPRRACRAAWANTSLKRKN